jgi:peptidoglycan/xylan/chitin deacetylase (PgdA/CDA1 family)
MMFNDCVTEACRHAPVGQWETGVPALGVVRVAANDRAGLAANIITQLKYLRPEHRSEAAHRLVETAGAPANLDLMMTKGQVVALRDAGMDIGSHTRTHPILRDLDAEEAEREIAEGRSDLEGILRERIDLFAYPNGRPDRDYGARDVAILRRLGIRLAVSTAWGYADQRHDGLQLPRVSVWAGNAWKVSVSLVWARHSNRGRSVET